MMLIVAAALGGAPMLGAIAAGVHRDGTRMGLMAAAMLAPLLAWAAFGLIALGIKLGGQSIGSDGEFGLAIGFYVAVVCLPISVGLALLGRRLGRH